MREVAVAFLEVRAEIDQTVEALLKVHNPLPAKDVRRAAKKIIRQHRDTWAELDVAENLPAGIADRVRELYTDDVESLLTEMFGALVTKEASRWLHELAVDVVIKMPPSKANQETSGVVIAGYGNEEVFPSFISFHIDAVVESHLKYAPDAHETVTHDSPVVVRPFAQRGWFTCSWRALIRSTAALLKHSRSRCS